MQFPVITSYSSNMNNPYSNTIKFLKAVNLLASPSGATIKRLMDNLSISRRSAFRLLQALEELGFPIIDEQSQPKTEKTYRLSNSYVIKLPNIAIPNPNLTGEEIILIMAIMDTCIRLKVLKETDLFKSARKKIMAMLPPVKKGKRT